MQAVLAPALARPSGLLESGMGAVVFVVLLILFLRLVDSGSEGNLSRTALEPQLLDLHVPGSRHPPEYIRNARTFLLPKPQHSTLTSQYPLCASYRYAKPKPESRLPQTRAVSVSLYYAVM